MQRLQFFFIICRLNSKATFSSRTMNLKFIAGGYLYSHGTYFFHNYSRPYTYNMKKNYNLKRNLEVLFFQKHVQLKSILLTLVHGVDPTDVQSTHSVSLSHNVNLGNVLKGKLYAY